MSDVHSHACMDRRLMEGLLLIRDVLTPRLAVQPGKLLKRAVHVVPGAADSRANLTTSGVWRGGGWGLLFPSS